MARPRKDSEIAPAKERLVEAFWTLLSQNTFQEITIARISNQAQVNHNTFYYHFKNIEELAVYSFEQNFLPEVSDILLKTLKLRSPEDALEEAVNITQQQHSKKDLNKRYARAALFAREDMVKFRELYGNRVINKWLAVAGKTIDDLTEDQRIEAAFIIGGLLSSVVVADIANDPEHYTQVIAKHLGPGIYYAMLEFVDTATE